MTTPESPKPIQELREAMDRVRDMRAMSGLVIESARYDAETDKTNQEFLKDFLEVLPVNLTYNRNHNLVRESNAVIINDPVEVRTMTSFAFAVEPDWHTYVEGTQIGIVIGERDVSQPKVQLTEIMLLSKTRTKDAENHWGSASSGVTLLTVPARPWRASRELALNKLHEPYSQEKLFSIYSSQINASYLTYERRLDMPLLKIAKPYREAMSSYINRRRLEHTSGPLNMMAINKIHRNLMSSDFEKYDVMRHLEYIAAAFSVGDEFDEVKAKRESQLPTHPEQKIFGLPDDYREAIEQHGMYEHGIPKEIL